MRYLTIPNTTGLPEPLDRHPSEIDTPLPDFPADKTAKPNGYKAWIENPATRDWHLLVAEGLNPHGKVGAENPPALLHGLVADYDSDMPKGWTDDEIDARLDSALGDRKDLRPTWAYRTWCGKPRLVWEFEHPVGTGTVKLAAAVLAELGKRLKLDVIAPGLDQASMKPGQPFHRGRPGTWRRTGEALPDGFLSEVFFSVGAEEAKVGVLYKIPFGDVADEVERRWPGMGRIEPGQMVATWWTDDPQLEKDRAAQVTEDGVRVYSSRLQGFVPWHEILGKAWADKYKETQTQKLREKCWWSEATGYYYHDLLETGTVHKRNKEDMTCDLMAFAGLSPKPVRKGDPLPETQTALCNIRVHGRVDILAPVHFNAAFRIVNDEGEVVLNTTRWKKPRTLPAGRGEPEDFPFLHKLATKFLDDTPDRRTGIGGRDSFLAWLQRIYVSALEGRWGRDPGHALFIVGDAGKGKSLVAVRLLPLLLGGGRAADAYPYLCGDTAFNGDLASKVIWKIDDKEPPNHPAARRRFTERIKQHVATPEMRAERKGIEAGEIAWGGRIVVTMNKDPRSIQSLPDMGPSVADKLMLVMVDPEWRHVYGTFDHTTALMVKELPYFADWLVRWKPPEAMENQWDTRFGPPAYHHPALLETAENLSPDAALYEAVARYIHSATAGEERKAGKTEARMTGSELWSALVGVNPALNHEYPDARALSWGLKAQMEKTLHGLVSIGKATRGRGIVWTVSLDKDKCPLVE